MPHIRYTCPTCGKVREVAQREDLPSRPFCSDRCQMIDLQRWFDGHYRASEPLDAPPTSDGQRSGQPTLTDEPAE